MPAAIAQKTYTISTGSLMGVLNLTMLRAPTMPRERMMLEVTAMMIRVVIMAMATRETLKLREYITPLKVFL